MVLRTIAVPDPAPGTDWSYVVPGNWIIDVQSVTASLCTSGGTPPATAVDVSGNGNDGTYNPDFTFGEPGLVSGDDSIAMSVVTPGTPTSLVVPLAGLDPAGDVTVCWWQRDNLTPDVSYSLTDYFIISDTVAGGSSVQCLWGGANTGIVPLPGPQVSYPVFIAWRLLAGSWHYYMNGAEIVGGAWAGKSTVPPLFPSFQFGFDLAGTPTAGLGPGVDEWSCWSGDIGAAAIADLYAAGLAGFTAYGNAMLALAPTTYYHLDELRTSGAGRAANLQVTNGAQVLGDYPGGFPASGFGVPQQWTWVTGLNSNGQTPGATATTAGIPRLILPAGYTVGTDTPDLAAGDQWSDITIWWDDSYQNATSGQDAFTYPPGALLVYRQEGT